MKPKNTKATKPGEGERRAVSGYRAQYLASAGLILDTLKRGDLEWVRIADPDAGKVDDLQIGRTARVDAYQVKWSKYGGQITLGNLITGNDSDPALLPQLAEGWKTLRATHPTRRIVVHLVTNKIASTSTRGIPKASAPLSPYHLAAFLEQAWWPAIAKGKIEFDGSWNAIWNAIRSATKLSHNEFEDFVMDCILDIGFSPPEETDDAIALVNLLFKTAASPENLVELEREELLRRLNWRDRYNYRNIHEFPSPHFLYRPIESTVQSVTEAIANLHGGYIGVFGPPGSGKSTLLTRTLRTLPVRLIRYYAFVPESQDPSILRGEAVNFLHDVTLRIQEAGFIHSNRPDPADRTALLKLFHEQIASMSNDFVNTGTKTVLLIDGLDHIEREQSVARSLLQDLPLPESIPHGVYIVLGSQTDELSTLPSRIHYALQDNDRRILIEKLQLSDVQLITREAIPEIDLEEQQQIFELSAGHPLALIYILKRLLQAPHFQERSQILNETFPYAGNIEEQYWSHWRKIENDEDLIGTLALLSRVRGAIALPWVAQWAPIKVLRKLQKLLLTYFQQEGSNHWVFFHNSFRLFLIRQTERPLPGTDRDQLRRLYHLDLAKKYRDSASPWNWETLFHLFSADEFGEVIITGDFSWFTTQVIALRPLDAIQSDIRLAIQAAGRISDVNALAKLTLIWAAVEQRANVLENQKLPDLLLKAGEHFKAAEHLRDGLRLRVDPVQALRLSVELIDAGLENEGRQVFSLAEPLELLSGQPIADDNRRPQNLWDLLREWVESAIVIRGPKEVITVVRRINVEPRRFGDSDPETEARSVRNWLLIQAAFICCQRGKWAEWELFANELRDEQNNADYYVLLLRSAEIARSNNHNKEAEAFLRDLQARFLPDITSSFDDDYEGISLLLDTSEALIRILDDRDAAQTWVANVPIIPLQEKRSRIGQSPNLGFLRFRSASIKYFLGETTDPNQLLQQAVEATTYGDYAKDNEKEGEKLLARAIYHLARLHAMGQLAKGLTSASFMQEVRWVIDLFGPKYEDWTKMSRHYFGTARIDVLRYVVYAAFRQGNHVLNSLQSLFSEYWTKPGSDTTWPVSLQRSILVTIFEVGGDRNWAANNLSRIEPYILRGHDPYGRVEQCEEQAEAWLMLDNKDAALRQLVRMVQAARGVASEKDYQLQNWVEWLKLYNDQVPEASFERIVLMLRRLIAIKADASGVVEALNKLLEVIFRWSPRRAVKVIQPLLEKHILDHDDVVVHILRAAASTNNVPVELIIGVFVDLVLPFTPTGDSELLGELIKIFEMRHTNPETKQMLQFLIARIRVHAVHKHRIQYFKEIAAFTQSAGIELSSVGLQPVDLEEKNETNNSQIDNSLYLSNGTRLTEQEVAAQINTVDDLANFFEGEDREKTRFFHWENAAERVIPKLGSMAEIQNFERLLTQRLKEYNLSKALLALSKRCIELGEQSYAWEIAVRALEASPPSGWSPYWDGGVRHNVLRHLILMDGQKAYDLSVKLYAKEVSERFRSPGQIIIHFPQILRLLTPEVHIPSIWTVVEAYLEDLFNSIDVTEQTEIERSFDPITGILKDDTPLRALTDLVTLYLDHPAYPIAQGAVRAVVPFLFSEYRDSITDSIRTALEGFDQKIERVLMALNAAALVRPEVVVPFMEILQKIYISPNFALRISVHQIFHTLGEAQDQLPRQYKPLPVVYSLELPSISQYNTEQSIQNRNAPHAINDPALILSPFDMQIRAFGEIAQLSEDALLYRAAQYFDQLKKQRTWLEGNDVIEAARLSAFLTETGLAFSFNKPKISAARYSLAYIMAEAYDGGLLSADQLRISKQLMYNYDPHFLLHNPMSRPHCITLMVGEDTGFSWRKFSEKWLRKPSDSVPLLNLSYDDGRYIIAERTRIRYLDDDWPEEERFAVLGPRDLERIWSKLGIEEGDPPFLRVSGAQTREYSNIKAPLGHLTISHASFEWETPGGWIALNPSVASALGWHLSNAGLFRWVNQYGEVMVESIWWKDGPIDNWSKHIHEEVSTGWLVVATQEALTRIQALIGRTVRGVLVRRRRGWHGSEGENYAIHMLSSGL